MRRALAFSVAILAGCVTGPQVVPPGGHQAIASSAGGATLVVYNAPWHGDPSDLGDYITPISVELRNSGPKPVRIAYVDFVLTDENGRRYPALDPFRVAPVTGHEDVRALPHYADAAGAPPPAMHAAPPPAMHMAAPPAMHTTPPPAMHAPSTMGRTVMPPSGTRPPSYAYPGYRPERYGTVVRPPPSGYGTALPPPSWHSNVGVYWGFSGFYPYPWWGSPFYPYYDEWVWGWSPAWYPMPRPPADVTGYGLPEGVLQTGGDAAGYLYFQRATDQRHRFTLTWEIHDVDGNLVGNARVPLVVEE